MIKISKFVKLTSIAIIGTWLALLPSSDAFAGNEQTEKEVQDIIKKLMTKDENGNYAEKLKNEDIVKVKGNILSKIKVLEDRYFDNMQNIGQYQKRLEELANEISEIKKELDTFDRLGIASGIAVAAGIVLLSFGTGGLGLLIAGIGGLVAAWLGSTADDPEKLRSMINGSYTWATKQLIDKTVPIDTSKISKIDLSKITDPNEREKAQNTINKALKVIEEYNSIANQLSLMAKDSLDTAVKLDDAIEENKTISPTLTAGQELYVYKVFIGKDPVTGTDKYQEYYFVLEGDTLKSITGVTRGCIPLPAKLAESMSCIFCPLFKTIFNAAQSMSTKSYNKLAIPLANVILIGFALVIAFMVLKNVSSFTKQDAPKFITELLVNMFKVLIAFYMLKNSNIVYGYIIGPLLKGGFEFGASFLYATKNNYLQSCVAQPLPAGVPGGVMPAYLYTNLECFIKAVQAEVAMPQSIGSSLMCVARNAGKTDIGLLRQVMWDFGMMFQGFAIWVMGWIISLAFAFYLIDATIQLGILGALMPFLIACWPFKLTNSYTGKGWNMFMNTFFVYVFMGLVVSINVELLGQGLTGGKGGFDAIKTALNNDNVQELKEILDIGFSGFLVLIACCLFAWKLTGQASDLAGTMSSGGGPKIGANIGGMAAKFATKTTQGTLKKGLKAGKFVSDKTHLTEVVNKGKDALINSALGMIGLGRKSGAAGNRTARNSFRQSQQNDENSASANNSAPSSRMFSDNRGSTTNDSPTTQNQVKKMAQSGPRSQNPATPEPNTPTPQAARSQNPATPESNTPTPQGTRTENSVQTQNSREDIPENQQIQEQQLRRQLENDYQNTANGRAEQQMIDTQAADVAQKQKVEKEALGKMNYHNRRADEYLKKSQKAANPDQKKKLEDLANQQFEEAVKAEAAYNKAKADTLKFQNKLNATKQEHDRNKNNFVQNEMNKRRK